MGAGTGLKSSLLILGLLLVFLPQAHAFGAGSMSAYLSATYHTRIQLTAVPDIASVSKIEGKNWRHGDIEDMLKTLAFIKGHKWTNMMMKRVYFGNWLRD